MNLTAQQKTSLVEKYDLLIWKTIHSFSRRCSNPQCSKEDLYQECVIVLLKHAQNAQTIEEAERFPFMDMHNAMCIYAMGSTAVTHPSRTGYFSVAMQSSAVDFSVCKNLRSPSPEDQVLAEVDFERFID